MKADLLQLGSLLTWWWFPSFGSTLLLNLLYSLSILRPPPPTSPHLRNTHIQLSRTIIIVSTLIYQLVQSTLSTAPNFYTLLSLPIDVDAEGVRRSFRSLAKLYHPDKISSTTDETIFIALRQAHDVLSNPTLRFAYDRFGPSITTWTATDSTRDYLHHGLLQLVSFYTINPLLYAIVGWINGRNDGISFWRLSTLFSLLAFELCLLISPSPPFWISLLFPGRTIFEVRQYSHSLFVNWFFASLQLSTALDVLEYGDAAMIERRRSKAEVKEAQLTAVRMKAEGLDRMVGTVEKMMLHSFAGEIKPWRQTTRKGEAEREMSAEEERLFERIDKVLLCRSLLQQHPQLMEMSQQKEGPVKEEEPQEGVKEESVKVEDIQPTESKSEEAKAAADEPIAMKAEPVEKVLPDSSTTAKVEVPIKELDEPIPTIQVKSEPVEQTLDINSVDTVDPTTSAPTIAASATSTSAEAGADDKGDGIVAEAVAGADVGSSMLDDTTTQHDAQAVQTVPIDTSTISPSPALTEDHRPLTSTEAIEPPSEFVSDIAETTPNQNSASDGVATAEPASLAAATPNPNNQH
ncbi:DnaJ-related protein SCJ1 [Pseudozyma hubeiensis]|nr:DnaJ-related protein SCJ1 [Pseudozyma hubeiensis]